MSERNTANLVQKLIEAVNGRDGGRIADLVADDVAHDRGGQREIGAEALRAYFATRAAKTGETLADAAILTGQDGGRAAVEFTRRGRSADGSSYSTAGGWFLDIDEGRISRISDYSAE